MTAVEFIRAGLDGTAGSSLEKIDNMKDALLTFPTPKGGNHPLWVMGHMAWSEGELMEIMVGKPNPVAKWKPIFGYGSEPTANASAYPSYEEVKKAFQNLRADTIKFLSGLSDADLDHASEKCPPEAKPFVGTYGKCFMVILLNAAGHGGQLCDARRAAGRKPLHM
jgi:DinB family protein